MSKNVQSNKNNKLQYTFDSEEEKYFYAWLLECQALGYIDWIYHKKKTYIVCREVKAERLNKKLESFTLTKQRTYTPDFIFKFNIKAKNLFYHDKISGYKYRPFFYCNNNRGLIYVDTKGAYNGNKADMIFPDRQSMMADKFNIYVQKVIPFALGDKNKNKDTLFNDTFTPASMINNKDYIYSTSKAGKWNKGESKLKFKVRKIGDYVKYKVID